MTRQTCTMLLLPALVLLNILPVQAKSARDPGDTFSMDISITGTVVVIGSCTFERDGPVDVAFGDVKYSAGTGHAVLEGSYRQELPSRMDCSGDTDGRAQMKLDSTAGSAVSYSGAKLLPVMLSGTRSDSLGVRLLADGKVQNIGEWFDVDMTTPPDLEAELVQTGDGSDFTGGADFTASATLTMAFN